MNKSFYIFFTLLSLTTSISFGQLGFCSGDLGAPIFVEDFGTGTSNGPALSTDITSYTYVDSGPEDGFYTISSQMQQLGAFHIGPDHTPGDTNGKAFIVNASFTADQFYQKTISGLCENTSYEFSAFLQNLYNINSAVCGGNGIPVDVRFQIWDSSDTVLLASGDTGDIAGTANPIWTQYGLIFETQAGQNEIILRMINNGNGGCGNDLAIDDIVFRACGDVSTISSDISGEEDILICNNQNSFTTTLSVALSSAVFLQWEVSNDAINWTPIAGATNGSYTTPVLNTTTYYRVNTATDIASIGNPLCSFLSEAYFIDFIDAPQAPLSNGNVNVCENQPLLPISVTVATGEDVQWYTSATSTEIIATGNSFTPTSPGIYYAQSYVLGTECASLSRTPVTLSQLPAPVVTNQVEQRSICINQESIQLNAGITNVSYLWSTGATTPDITISNAGTYSVTMTNTAGCSVTKTFQVTGIASPVVANITTQGENIIIDVENEGNWEYSLNGSIYYTQPIFRNQPGGIKTIFVRNTSGCLPVIIPYYHYNIPTYFTPNDDGINDYFLLPDATYFNTSFIQVFNRYGKLIASGNGTTFTWDGRFNGKLLPPDDYWYVIELDNKRITGHISLLL
jgi:gliding motility-associated-like protein